MFFSIKCYVLQVPMESRKMILKSLMVSLQIYNIFANNTWNLGGFESPIDFNAIPPRNEYTSSNTAKTEPAPLSTEAVGSLDATVVMSKSVDGSVVTEGGVDESFELGESLDNIMNSTTVSKGNNGSATDIEMSLTTITSEENMNDSHSMKLEKQESDSLQDSKLMEDGKEATSVEDATKFTGNSFLDRMEDVTDSTTDDPENIDSEDYVVKAPRDKFLLTRDNVDIKFDRPIALDMIDTEALLTAEKDSSVLIVKEETSSVKPFALTELTKLCSIRETDITTDLLAALRVMTDHFKKKVRLR